MSDPFKISDDQEKNEKQEIASKPQRPKKIESKQKAGKKPWEKWSREKKIQLAIPAVVLIVMFTVLLLPRIPNFAPSVQGFVPAFLQTRTSTTTQTSTITQWSETTTYTCTEVQTVINGRTQFQAITYHSSTQYVYSTNGTRVTLVQVITETNSLISPC